MHPCISFYSSGPNRRVSTQSVRGSSSAGAAAAAAGGAKAKAAAAAAGAAVTALAVTAEQPEAKWATAVMKVR